MELNEKQLTELEEWAGIGYSPEDIADILGLDKIKLRASIESDGEIRRRYRKGLLVEMGKVLQAVKKSAIDGSSPAQTLILKKYEDLIFKINED